MIPLFQACGTSATPCSSRERRDPQHLGDPAAPRDVGLDQVDVAALDQLAEAPAGRVLLAGRDRDVDRVRQLGVGLVLVRLERLLEPVDAELLELARDADRDVRVGDVAEPGVDQDLDAVSAGLAGGGGEPDVVVGILAERPPAELDRREALLAERRDRLGDLLGRVRHQPGRVGADPVVLDGAEQLADRLAERLPLDVPERDVDAADRVDRDPAAADEDHAAIHLVPEPLDVERVLADQQLAQALRDRVRAGRVHERRDGLGRRVDLADAGDPLVGVDQDDEIVLAAVRDPLVHGGLPQDDGLDIGDLQACLPLAAGLSIITRLSTITRAGLGTACVARRSSSVSRRRITSALSPSTSTVAGRGSRLNWFESTSA